MEVLHTNVVIRDSRKRHPQSRPVVGDIAGLGYGPCFITQPHRT